jgi:polar amino acid transport system substrate-binding protein
MLFWFAGQALGADQVFLAVPLSMQPYFIVATNKGYAYEIMEAAFAASGRKVFPVYLSERNLNEELLDLRQDIDCTGFQSTKKKEDWFVMDDIFSFHDYAITLAANNIQINDIADLIDKKVIAYLGASEQLGAEFRAAMAENPRYREIYNHRSQIKLLLKNRVQVIIADKLLVDWYVGYLTRELEQPTELTFHDLFPPGSLRFACRQPELLHDFTKGMEQIRRNGKLDKIRSQYIKSESISPRT